jgi:hypothetical protein
MTALSIRIPVFPVLSIYIYLIWRYLEPVGAMCIEFPNHMIADCCSMEGCISSKMKGL